MHLWVNLWASKTNGFLDNVTLAKMIKVMNTGDIVSYVRRKRNTGAYETRPVERGKGGKFSQAHAMFGGPAVAQKY